MTTTVLAYIPSPSQGVWHLGPFPLRAYALFIIVGIVAALVLGDRRWVARGGEPGVIYDVALWAVPFGLIGGRAYHVITDWRTYFGEDGAGLVAAFRIWDGGLGIWGAVALGGIGAWIACRRRGIPLPAFGDAVAPGIVLAQAIGRLGNYFNQELFGRETTLPWGLEIYERVNSAGQLDMLNGVSTGRLALDYAVHPTFLYELLWNLLVFAMLILVDRKFKIGHGRLFALYVAGYCVGRFWIELMRSDTATLLAGIRINTFTATFVFIGAVVYIMAAPKGREDPATLRGNEDAEAGVEDVVKDVAVGSAVGIVAAAKAADEDDADAAEKSAGGLGSVEGDEAVEAAEGASAAHDQSVEGATEAHALAADLSEPEVEDSAEPTADVGTVPPPHPAETEGLGSVEGDEIAEATAGAAVVHEAAVESEADAEELAAEAESAGDADETPAEESEGLGSVEGDEVAAAVGDAAVVHEAAVDGEADAEDLAADVESRGDADADETPAEESGGLGSVEGDEVAAAVGDASVVHEAAVEGEADAEDLAAEVDAEDESDNSEGLGSVEGDEVAAAVGDASVVHEAAVDGEADAEELAAGVESEDESEELVAEVEPEGDADESPAEESKGLGSVEGDEVAAAVGDAAVVHEAAVEGEADAEDLAAEVESEDESEELVTDVEPEGDADADESPAEESEGLGSVDGDEVAAAVGDAAVVHEAAVEGEADAEELAAEVDAEDESDNPEGLGSVEGDEIAAAVGEAPEVHEAAVEGEADAEELAAEAEAEGDVDTEPEADAEVVEGDAEEQVAIEGADAAEALTADDASEDSSDETGSEAAPEPAPTMTPTGRIETSRSERVFDAAGRARQWIRRRRNR